MRAGIGSYHGAPKGCVFAILYSLMSTTRCGDDTFGIWHPTHVAAVAIRQVAEQLLQPAYIIYYVSNAPNRRWFASSHSVLMDSTFLTNSRNEVAVEVGGTRLDEIVLFLPSADCDNFSSLAFGEGRV